MKLYLLIIVTLFLSCVKEPCKEAINGEAVLVAFKVAKHSYAWFENPKTNIIHRVSLGRKKEPTVNLGGTINVQYCVRDSSIIMIDGSYKRSALNRNKRFESLNGYEYLK